jgi:uncharacterized short protein YbdD (DUF466 family)
LPIFMLTLPVRIKKQAMMMIGKNDYSNFSPQKRQEPLLMRECFLQSKMTRMSQRSKCYPRTEITKPRPVCE